MSKRRRIHGTSVGLAPRRVRSGRAVQRAPRHVTGCGNRWSYGRGVDRRGEDGLSHRTAPRAGGPRPRAKRGTDGLPSGAAAGLSWGERPGRSCRHGLPRRRARRSAPAGGRGPCRGPRRASGSGTASSSRPLLLVDLVVEQELVVRGDVVPAVRQMALAFSPEEQRQSRRGTAPGTEDRSRGRRDPPSPRRRRSGGPARSSRRPPATVPRGVVVGAGQAHPRRLAGDNRFDDLLDEPPSRVDLDQFAHARRPFGECRGQGSVHAGERGSTRMRDARRPVAEPALRRNGRGSAPDGSTISTRSADRQAAPGRAGGATAGLRAVRRAEVTLSQASANADFLVGHRPRSAYNRGSLESRYNEGGENDHDG